MKKLNIRKLSLRFSKHFGIFGVRNHYSIDNNNVDSPNFISGSNLIFDAGSKCKCSSSADLIFETGSNCTFRWI
jgi:hypothetical protein